MRGAATLNACSKNKCEVHPRAPDRLFLCCCNTHLCNTSQRIKLTIAIFMCIIIKIF